MTNFRLTIITKNQKSNSKAKKLADLISNQFENVSQIIVDPYHKFENSFKIDLVGEIPQNVDPLSWFVIKSNSIVKPWLINYTHENNECDLIFNKSENSKFSIQDLNVIYWAHMAWE